MSYEIICVFIMFIATLLPRVIPLTFFSGEIKNKTVKSFLYYVPYAVLTALTFPAIFTASGNVIASVAGTIVAVVLSLIKKPNLILTIIASVVVTYILLLIF